MGLLDAFNETWSQARETFGQGTPEDGSKFDGSSRLLQMKSSVEAAAPDSRWQGTASDAYAAANKEHAQVYGKLADLDKRMAAEVTNAANVVTTGRQNLDNVKSWVSSMAASIPDTDADERNRKLLPIVNKGVSQLSDIIQKSTNDMTDIRGRVQGIKGEYDALTNQKFAPGKGPGEKKDEKGNKKDGKPESLGAWQDRGNGELKPEDMEGLVRDALNGNQEAASKVDGILNGIDTQKLGPNSKSHPLSPVEAELVGQMQAQMKPMSMDDLKAAREKLGPHKNILANAMQIMSDPDVTYPRHDGDGPQIVTPGHIPNDGVLPGDKGALPDGVQEVLNRSAVVGNPNDIPAYHVNGESDLRDLAAIIADGDSKFQQGSYLDGGLMSKASEILTYSNGIGVAGEMDPVMEDIFKSAGRDAIVNHELLTGAFSYNSDGQPRDLVPGANGASFLDNLTQHHWQDGGSAARTLTDWIDDAAGGTDPVMKQLAGESAHSIADYLGDNRDKLVGGIGTPGHWNPNLIQGYGEALAPFQESMIGDRRDPPPGFGPLDGQREGNYSHARSVFEIINGDPAAAKAFNTHAYEKILQYQEATAQMVADGKPPSGTELGHAGRLLGVLNEAADAAGTDKGLDVRKAAIKLAFDNTAGKLPFVGGGVSSDILQNLLQPQKPDSDSPYPLSNVQDLNKWVVASALHATDMPIPPGSALNNYLDDQGHLRTPEWIAQNNPDAAEDYYQALFDYTANTTEWETVFGSFDSEFDVGTGLERGVHQKHK